MAPHWGREAERRKDWLIMCSTLPPRVQPVRGCMASQWDRPLCTPPPLCCPLKCWGCGSFLNLHTAHWNLVWEHVKDKRFERWGANCRALIPFPPLAHFYCNPFCHMPCSVNICLSPTLPTASLFYFSYLSFHLMVSTTVQDLAKGGFKWSFQSCNRSIVCNTPLPLDSALLSQVYLGNKRGGREIWQARGAGHVKGVRLIFYFFPFGCISAGWWTALLEEVGGAVEAVTAQLKFSQECHCTIHVFLGKGLQPVFV